MNAKRRSILKKMIAVLSVILVMLIGVAGTLAYLQVQTGPVQNTFAPSNIDLKLEETNVDGDSATANTYKMIPGVEIAKDPKVTVTADIDCYVFVEVTETTNFDTYMTYAIASGWKLFNTTSGEVTETVDTVNLDNYVLFREVSAAADEDSNGDKNVEAFYVLAGNTTYPNGVVTVPNTVTKGDMDGLYNNNGTVKDDAELPKLTFTAYAIQKAGFESNLLGAWNEAHGQAS